MKKLYLLLLASLVVFSSFFVSCDEWNDDVRVYNLSINSEDNGRIRLTGLSASYRIDSFEEELFNALEEFSDSQGKGEGIDGFTSASLEVLHGWHLWLRALPNKDCYFIGWFVDDDETPVSTDDEYYFSVTGNIYLTAKFGNNPVVTISSAGDGVVSFKESNETSMAVLPGTEVSVVAIPDENCDFIGWFAGDEEAPISTDAEYTFTVTENVALIAKFSRRPVVTICGTGYGSAFFKDYNGSSVAVLSGTEVTVVAVPDENYHFVGWFIDKTETPISIDSEFVFTVTENITLIAEFCKNPLVTIRSAGYGDVFLKNSYETSMMVLPGTEVTAVAIPNENCDFIGWFTDYVETPVSTEIEYTFSVSENITLTAKFNHPPVVTLSSVGNGRVYFKDTFENSKMVMPGTEVTIIAAPDENFDFAGWFVSGVETLLSVNIEYTFVVTVDVDIVAKFERRKTYIDGYEYIDLGLPSGLKWATHNVGATSPEEYGGYYAWGEVYEKENYNWRTYQWCNGTATTLTRYCTNYAYGFFDNRTKLLSTDDVAHVVWGGGWRMPTDAEQYELYDNCIWTWTVQNGVNGYKVTGPNGNSIFLPAAGYRSGAEVNDRDNYGYYWSSTVYNYSNNEAWHFILYANKYYRSADDRYYGYSVRPVCD